MTTDPKPDTEPDRLRAHYYFPESQRNRSDEALQAAIDGAKKWIDGRRMSWTIVACLYLRDGWYHT